MRMLCFSAELDALGLGRTSYAGRPTERVVRLSRDRSRGSGRAGDGGVGMVVAGAGAGAGFGRRAGRMVLLIPRVLVAALGKDTAAAAAGSAAGLAVAGVRFPSSSLRGRQGPFPLENGKSRLCAFRFPRRTGANTRKHNSHLGQQRPRPDHPNIVYHARSASTGSSVHTA